MSHETEFDLFLDESGSFYENSYNLTERAAEAARKKKFPSQLAGVLAPCGTLTENAADEILNSCCAQAGWPLPSIVHMKEYVEDAHRRGMDADFRRRYNVFIRELIKQLRARNWQPVLLVNLEGVSYGNMLQTYPNMVAELFLRACRQKQKEGLKKVSINLKCASVQIQIPSKFQMPNSFYLWRLRECQSLTAVRKGYAPESSKWRLGSFELKDARKSKTIQICDVLTHSSHDGFSWCNSDTKALFKSALGKYCWTMVIREALERAEQLIEDRSLGLALITLSERLAFEDDQTFILEEVRRQLARVLDDLAPISTSVRNSQLGITLSQLEQLITLQRDLDLGIKLARWLLRKVEAPLRERLRERAHELDWFTYALHLWALTACNHKGALIDAKEEVAGIERLLPSLAGQWEHLTLLTEGLIARAVQQTDCFEFAEASAQMESIAERYEHLAKLFSGSLPDQFQQEIHSDLRAKALGTWLQSEILDGFKNNERLASARRLSDAAISEFHNRIDKERQYQYRCQLETLAGNFATAREFLAWSLHAPASHSAIADAIQRLAHEPVEQGFALMHWLRLGSALLLAESFEAVEEAKQFQAALERSILLDSSWCMGRYANYPAHSILRRLAVIQAVQSRDEQALQSLATLRRLAPVESGHIVLCTILLAAQAELAALFWDRKQETARRLVYAPDGDEPGIKQLTALISSRAQRLFPGVIRLADTFATRIDDVLGMNEGTASAGRSQRTQLLELGQLVRY
jgi:hypothetical protein